MCTPWKLYQNNAYVLLFWYTLSYSLTAPAQYLWYLDIQNTAQRVWVLSCQVVSGYTEHSTACVGSVMSRGWSRVLYLEKDIDTDPAFSYVVYCKLE